MSTSPYSIDLRKKVISYIESGKSQESASRVFALNPSTVNRWWLRYKREGHYNARPRIGKKPRVTSEEIKCYVSSTPDFTSEKMGKYFGMSASGARYWLRKLGYSYKKKTSPTWKRAKKREGDIEKV